MFPSDVSTAIDEYRTAGTMVNLHSFIESYRKMKSAVVGLKRIWSGEELNLEAFLNTTKIN